MNKQIQLISAPSTLGLQSNGVEKLAQKFLNNGLREKLGTKLPVIEVPTRNDLRSNVRDSDTLCLNSKAIEHFSIDLAKPIVSTVESDLFAIVLGGDCSILLGIMPALKTIGTYGLIFLDAHADFYQPEKSTTGEVADMDLAIVTGRGPDQLSNINDLKPYVLDKNVIHLAQRDEGQAEEYGSQDIRKTDIQCYSLKKIRESGIQSVTNEALHYLQGLSINGFWIHFDTDVLDDALNPAVDYRLPGGLQFDEVTSLIGDFLKTGKMIGVSVTIYNANLDIDGHIAAEITTCLSKAFA
jgi:arginase